MNSKVIITNLAALKKKYGVAGLKRIKAAIKALIAADKARGFQTTLTALDSAEAMKKVKGKKVADAKDPAQNKAAIDAIYRALVPDYVMLLGALDVIPHQDLINPVFSPGNDDDEYAYGDLPYACEAPYSPKVKDFVGPTRVVGRLPDLTGGTDPAYLLGLLATATGWISRPAADYSGDFAISAEVWKKSTALSVQRLFGASGTVQLAPPGGPAWGASLLAKRPHFINCHGASADPQFYGQKGNSYPVSHQAARLAGKIAEGTVVAVECCYGAELYDPLLAGGQAGICSTYLAEKAYGYFGSSTIAYGPAVGNGAADLICQYFLRRVIAGSSIGRAALEARLEFAGGAAELDPVDLKTLAQFSLLGDPSIHPVAASTPHAVMAAPGTKGPAAKGLAAAIANAAAARTDRRRQLLSRGLRIGASQPCAVKLAKAKPAGPLMAALKKLAAQLDIPDPDFLAFKIETPAAPKGTKPLSLKAGPKAMMAAPDGFHVVSGSRNVSALKTPQIVAMVAKEVGGKIVSYREMHGR